MKALSFGLATVLMVGTAAWAEEPNKSKVLIRGQLRNVDAEKSTITVAVGEKDREFQVTDGTVFLDFDGKPTDLTITSPLLNQLVKNVESPNVKITSELRDRKEVLISVKLPLRINKDDLTPEQRRYLKDRPVRDRLVGKPLPAFKMTNIQGATLANDNVSGKVVVIDFWATWCGPCLKVSPIMQELHDQYAEKGLVVIGASIETDQDEGGHPIQKTISNYRSANNCKYEFCFNANVLADACEIPVLPTMLVVDRKGMIRMVQVGFWEDEDLRSKLEKIIRRLLDQS